MGYVKVFCIHTFTLTINNVSSKRLHHPTIGEKNEQLNRCFRLTYMYYLRSKERIPIWWTMYFYINDENRNKSNNERQKYSKNVPHVFLFLIIYVTRKKQMPRWQSSFLYGTRWHTRIEANRNDYFLFKLLKRL